MKRPHFHITLTQTFQYFHMLIQLQKKAIITPSIIIKNDQNLNTNSIDGTFIRSKLHRISGSNFQIKPYTIINSHTYWQHISLYQHMNTYKIHIHNQNKPHQRIDQWTQSYLKISIRIQIHLQITLVTRLKLQNTKPWVHLLDGHYPGNLPHRYVSKPGRANNQ